MDRELILQLQQATKEQVNALRNLMDTSVDEHNAMEEAKAHLTVLKASAKDVFAARGDTLSTDETLLKEDLHAAAGNALAATTLFLEQDGAITRQAVNETWSRVLRLIETGIQERGDSGNAADALYQAAGAAGIRLTLTTPLPTDRVLLRSFMKDASAALLQAAREGQTELTL